MRHLVKGNKLGRSPSHRKATMSALSRALIREHRIVTTVAKAKELRTYVEPLITKAKKDSSHNRRQVFSKLNDKAAVSHLFDEVAQKAMDRPGGYTRVVKLGYRKGDNAQTAVIELVDYNDIQPEDSKKTRRTRRAGKSKSEPDKTSEPATKADEAEKTKETVSDSEEAVEEDSNDKKEKDQESSEEE